MIGWVAFAGDDVAVKVNAEPTGAMLTGVLITTLVRLTGVAVTTKVFVTVLPALVAVTVTTCGPSALQVNTLPDVNPPPVNVCGLWLVADQV